MQLAIVDSEQGIKDLIEYIQDKEYVAYDCETDGVHASANVIGISVCAEEDKAFYVILHRYDPELQILVPDSASCYIEPLIKLLKTKKLIMHNAIFDCAKAEHNFKISLIESVHTDTMILAHLLNENRRIGLKELAREYFGEDSTTEQSEMKASVIKNGGRLTKDCYEMFKCDSYIMARYGAKDALLTYKLFLELVPELYEQGLDRFFYDDESMPLLRGPTYDLNTTGLKVDQKALTSLKKTLEAECAELKSFIFSEIGARIKDKYPGANKKSTFNLGSKPQLSWLLFGEYQLEFGTLTDAGKEVCKFLEMKLPYTPTAKRNFIAQCISSKGRVYEGSSIFNGRKKAEKKVRDPWNYIAVDKSVLAKHAPRLKWVDALLSYQKKQKLLSTYIKGIEERIQYGIIRPSFLQAGTTGGRYASRDPNFQNLPRDDKRIKGCIVARPGKTFVGADYSQLEPRIFAFVSGDERLLGAFKGNNDFYSVVGVDTYEKFDATTEKSGEKSFKVLYPNLRQDSKVFTLAATYGANGFQLGPVMGKTPNEAQEDIDNYFERFPKVRKMMLDSHELAKSDGQVINLFGRPRRIPEAKKINKLYGNIPHSELPYVARSLLNLAVNHRIQSTAASIVNRAAIKFHSDCRSLGIICKIVLQVHDSLIIECDADVADQAALLLQNAMETAVELQTVALEAIPKVGLTLADV